MDLLWVIIQLKLISIHLLKNAVDIYQAIAIMGRGRILHILLNSFSSTQWSLCWSYTSPFWTRVSSPIVLRIQNNYQQILALSVWLDGHKWILNNNRSTWKNNQKLISILKHKIKQIQIINLLWHSHLIIQKKSWSLFKSIINFNLKKCHFLIIFSWKDFSITVCKYLLFWVVVRHV